MIFLSYGDYMNKKDFMFKFISEIEKKGLMTEFIINIFDYKNFHDYNYLFRLIDRDNEIIMDIYDNVSNNRFNRYVFNFENSNRKNINERNVFLTYINLSNIMDSDIKLYKLGYLFTIDVDDMIIYAKSFLNDKFVTLLENIISQYV